MRKIFYPGLLMFSELVYSKLTGKRMPIYVSLQVTKKCNLKCRYCYADLESLKNKNDFTTEEMINLIDEMSKMGTRWVRILGGEPLLREDIGILINHMKKRNMICEMSTNGYFLRNKIDELRNLDSLCFSIDGPREVHDFYRGSGSYDKVMEAIKLAKENGLPVRLHTVLTKKSVRSFMYVADFAKENNIPCNFSLYSAFTEDKCKDVALSHSEIKKFFNKLKELKKKGYPFFNSNYFFETTLNWPVGKDLLFKKDLKNVKFRGRSRCKAGKLSCWIDSDGGVYPCPVYWKKGLNIRDVGFKKAWDNLKNNTDCVACLANGDIETFAILDLNPRVYWNIIKALFFQRMYNKR